MTDNVVRPTPLHNIRPQKDSENLIYVIIVGVFLLRNANLLWQVKWYKCGPDLLDLGHLMFFMYTE